MKCIVVSGSRNPDGQTARAAGALAEGVVAAGGECETLLLPTMAVERCRQCDAAGWGACRTEGRCVIEDDFAAAVKKLRYADAAVFATPVYWSDLAEGLRAFLDRLRRTSVHEEGKRGFAGKPAVGVCVAGGGGGGAPACAVGLEKVLRTIGFDVIDLVPVRRQNLEFKLDILRRTGEWLVDQAASSVGDPTE
ncbi:MAG: flavodoxin family protein [Planctomycetota bacterium]|jgi:multimeric flavodoxin WrbA